MGGPVHVLHTGHPKARSSLLQATFLKGYQPHRLSQIHPPPHLPRSLKLLTPFPDSGRQLELSPWPSWWKSECSVNTCWRNKCCNKGQLSTPWHLDKEAEGPHSSNFCSSFGEGWTCATVSGSKYLRLPISPCGLCYNLVWKMPCRLMDRTVFQKTLHMYRNTFVEI
jgi:hypothetical protein